MWIVLVSSISGVVSQNSFLRITWGFDAKYSEEVNSRRKMFKTILLWMAQKTIYSEPERGISD